MASVEDVARKRRAPGEVERLIIDAAREVFAAKGYAGATTREIAGVANVHEPMVYRRFSSKAKLFEATVLEPFNELISNYLDAFPSETDPSDTLEELARRFFEPFYDILLERRDLLIALLAASHFHDDFSGDGKVSLDGLGRLIDRLEPQFKEFAAARGLAVVDVAAALRVSIAMVVGVVILGDWLDGKEPVGRDRLVDEIVRTGVREITGGEGGAVTAEPAGGMAAEDVSGLLDRVAEAERRAIRAELELDVLKQRSGS